MHTMLQIKAQLQGVSKPPVWRRLLIPTRTTFYELHLILQEAIPWMDYHLHNFETKTAEIISLFDFEDEDYFTFSPPSEKLLCLDIETLVFHSLLQQPKIDYYYDFGDGWHWKITLEKIVENDTASPQLLSWKGTAPPEDCGGTGGYERLKEILANPDHEEYSMLKDWAESQGYGDPDVKAINETLANFFQDPEYVHTVSPYAFAEEEEEE